jgi:hypothetical protein
MRYAVALAGLAIALAGLILVPPVLPLQDAPDHLAMLRVRELVLAGDPALGRLYEARPLSPAYGAFYAFAEALRPGLSLEAALRLWLLATAGLWIAGLHALLATSERGRPYVFLAAPLVFGNIFYLGFLNLLPVYPLAALGLGVMLRRPRGALRVPILAAISIATLLLHLIGFALWLALAAPLAAVLEPGTRKEKLLAALPPLAGIPLVPLVLHGAPVALEAQGGVLGFRWLWPSDKARLLLESFLPVRGVTALATVIALIAAVLLVRRERERGVALRATPEDRGRAGDVLAVAALVALGAAVLAPFARGAVSYLDVRFVPLVLLLALAAASRLLPATRAVRAGTAALALVLYAGTAWAFADFVRRAAPVRELTASAPPGSRLLPLIVTRRPRALAVDACLKLSGYLALDRGWVHPYLTKLGAGEMPLEPIARLRAPDLYDPLSATREDLDAFDLVLLQADPDFAFTATVVGRLEPLLAGWKLVDTKGSFRLYAKP